MESSKSKGNLRGNLSLRRRKRKTDNNIDDIMCPNVQESQATAIPESKISSPGKLPKTDDKMSVDRQTVQFNRTITEWIRNPDRERRVRCPVCNCKVLHSKINDHLDTCVVKDGITLGSGLNPQNSACIDLTKESEDLASKTNGSKITAGNSKATINKITHSKPLEVMSLENGCNTKDIASSGAVKRLATLTSFDNQEICLSDGAPGGTFSGDLDNKSSTETINIQTAKNSSTNVSAFKMSPSSNINSSESSKSSENHMWEPMETSNESIDNMTEQDNVNDPYYLANFKLVLNTVLSNEEDKRLFNEADMQEIERFQHFSVECQKLYVRLLQRRPGWFRGSKLDYPKIAKDLSPILQDLQKSGFLESEKSLTDLKEALKLLSVADLKDLAKSLHVIHNKTAQGQTKSTIINALIKHGETQRTIFGNASAIVLKRAKALLGSCVCVSQSPKSVFLRVLLLFTMNIIPEEDEENKQNGQIQQLSTIFLANIGKLLYPEYNLLRELTVFADRNYLITFAKAYQDKHEMFSALEVTGDLDLAYNYYPNAAESFKSVLDSLNAPKKPFSATLPVHLRCFSSEWVYTKMCYLGVEVLQKMKRYDEAVEQLKLLLQQNVYCADCRGKWWERLALNTHQHLKQPLQALEFCKQGLEDPYVRFGRRLALVQRVKKILLSAWFKKRKDADVCCIDEELLKEPKQAETITIQGKRSEQLGVFISHEVTKSGEVKDETMTFLSVEEYALSHYRQEGYDEGIHGETSTFTTLYGLFFWDIIFVDGIPDVFRAPFQSSPLDLNHDTFYERRKTIIDNRLEEIRSSSLEDLLGMFEQSWNENNGRICSGVSWERFCSLDQAKQFVSCIGGRILCGIFKHFAQDMRHWHSGMPDLVVWNSSTLDYRIVEVKGPGDRLSTKQQIWLSELASFGATVEVCYVTAVGGKKPRSRTAEN